MAKYGFAIDVTRCTGCHNCFVSCKDEFDSNDYLPISVAQPAGGQDWIRIKEVEQGSGFKVKVDYFPDHVPALRRCSVHENRSRRRCVQKGRRHCDH